MRKALVNIVDCLVLPLEQIKKIEVQDNVFKVLTYPSYKDLFVINDVDKSTLKGDVYEFLVCDPKQEFIELIHQFLDLGSAHKFVKIGSEIENKYFMLNVDEFENAIFGAFDYETGQETVVIHEIDGTSHEFSYEVNEILDPENNDTYFQDAKTAIRSIVAFL